MRICTAFAIAVLAGCAPAVAQDLEVCEFRRVVDVQQRTVVDRLPWYAGESVGYTVVARRDGAAVRIPEGTLPVWLVLDAATNAYVVSTGTVVSATNGEVRFWLPAPQANLPAGDYLSYASVYQGTNRVGVLDRAIVRVSWRPGDDFEAAAPLTNVLDQVAGWYADAMAAVAAYSNALDEAAEAAQSNLTAHATDTDNPHQVTPAQIGAATGTPVYVESDPAALASMPTNVVCAGGYHFSDYFSLSASLYGYEVSSYGATSGYNSVNAQWVEFGRASGYLLDPEVVRQASWSSAVEYSDPQNVEVVETNGQTVALWLDGIEVGATGRVTATLGEFSRTVDFTRPADGVSFSNRYWVSDLAGSLRAHVNTSLLARASRTGAFASVYAAGAYAQTNFVRDTNCWVYGIDLTCASPWNSDWHMYKAGTAVTPQHFLYAAHFVAPTGTVFRWIDATNGIHDRTLVDQRILSSDIAIGRLDSPLGSSIVPAKVIAEGDVGRLRGAYGLRNCPGFRLFYLDQAERAWLAKSPFMENTTYQFQSIAGFYGDTNLPFSRLEAEGGDSGNPVFMAIGTNTVLFSTFHGPKYGPLFCGHQAEIEAAMSSMGASIYTNLPKIDLSTWTNYDSGADMPNM